MSLPSGVFPESVFIELIEAFLVVVEERGESLGPGVVETGCPFSNRVNFFEEDRLAFSILDVQSIIVGVFEVL